MSEPSSTARPAAPDLGIGVGLRVPHYAYIRQHRPKVDFFELISENFMLEGGKPLVNLDHVTAHYPVVAHGVSLNIGGPSEPDPRYLRRLEALVRRTRPAWASDHLCWTGTGKHQIHDLLPLPYTKAIVERVAERARRVQDTLGVPFALENTSSYMTYRSSEMSEWQFLGEVAERADIGILLDVNNVYVSAYNHGFDAYEYLRGIPHERVVQMHLAGHTNLGKLIIDTHNGDVIEPVWDLYRAAVELCGPVSTLIEWDDEIPEFPKLIALSERARSVREQALDRRQNLELNPYAPSFVRGKTLSPRPDRSAANAAERSNGTELHAWTELQHALVQAVQQPRALHKSAAVVARAEGELTSNDRLSPVEQLEVYREQFWLRHTSALLEDFPGVSGILGQRHWEPLVEGYLQRHPPDSWTLRDLGRHFAQYVASQTELPHHALCVDMARLECLYTEVFDAADSTRLDPEKLASIPVDAWDDVRVRFSPCLRTLRVGYPVARLRKQLRERLGERPGEHETHADDAVELPSAATQNLVLYRDNEGGLCFSALQDAAAALIEALQSGARLRAACQSVAERVHGSASTLESSLGSWFASWGAKGWIVDVVSDPITESNQ